MVAPRHRIDALATVKKVFLQVKKSFPRFIWIQNHPLMPSFLPQPINTAIQEVGERGDIHVNQLTNNALYTTSEFRLPWGKG